MPCSWATETGRSRTVEIILQRSPHGGRVVLYRCPACQHPRRYLYRLAASLNGLVDYFGLQCHTCAGLRWASQGRYRRQVEQSLCDLASVIYGQPVRNPISRYPWDPRAVSGLSLIEFANRIGGRGGNADVLRLPHAALVAGSGMPPPQRARIACIPDDQAHEKAVNEVPTAVQSLCASSPRGALGLLQFFADRE